MMDMASIVMDTFIGIAILCLVVKAIMRTNHRHIPNRELQSSEISHAFRKMYRP